MKKIKFYVIGLTLLIIGLWACQKKTLNSEASDEFSLNQKSKINYSKIKTKLIDIKSLENERKILSFDNMETFKATLNDLQRQTNERDSLFVAYYNNLDEDELIDKEEEINFDENKPLIDFDKNLSFNSLYQKIATEEENWLNNEILDDNNDPDNHFIEEEELRALLNVESEVEINDTIYKIIEEGYYAIIDGNLNTLSLLENITDNNNLPDNVIFVGDDYSYCKSSGCHSNRSNRDFKYNDNDTRRIKYVVSHWTHPWDRRVMAKTKNYKKRHHRWKKYRTSCTARVYGKISTDNNCTNFIVFNTANGACKHKSHSKKVKHKINVSTKTKSGWVKGYFYGAGGISLTKTLTF